MTWKQKSFPVSHLRTVTRHPVFRLMFSQAFGQVFLALSALAIALLFSETEIADFALFFTFVTIVTPVGALRLEWGIVNAAPDRRIEIFAVGMASAFVVSLLAMVVFFGLSYIAIAPFGPRLIPYAPLVFWSTFLGSGGQLCLYSMVADEAYNRLSLFNFLNQALRAVVPILLVLSLARAPYMMAIGELAARAVVFIIFAAPYLRDLVRTFRSLSATGLRRVARTNRKFITISTPSSLADALSANIMTFLIGARFGAETAGAVWFSQRILAFPVSLAAKAAGDYLHGRLAKFLSSGDRAGARRLFLKATTLLSLCSTTLLLGAILIVPLLGRFEAANQWSIALSITPYFAILPTAFMLSAPLSRSILVTSKQEQKLIYDALSFSSALLAYWAAGQAELSIQLTVLSIASSQAIAALIYVRISFTVLDAPKRTTPS